MFRITFFASILIITCCLLEAVDANKWWSCFGKLATTRKDQFSDIGFSLMAWNEIDKHLTSSDTEDAKEVLKLLISKTKEVKNRNESTSQLLLSFKLFNKMLTAKEICSAAYVNVLENIINGVKHNKPEKTLKINSSSSSRAVNIVHKMATHQAIVCRDTYLSQFKEKNLHLDAKQLTVLDTFTDAVIKSNFGEDALLNRKLLIQEIILQDKLNLIGGAASSAKEQSIQVGTRALKEFLLSNGENYTKLAEKNPPELLVKEACLYYGDQLEEDVFVPAVFGMKFDDSVQQQNDEFYRSIARYKVCKYLLL